MPPAAKSSILRRLKRDLPPTPPHPAIVQTLAGMWSPYTYVEHCQAMCGDRFTLYPLDMLPIVFFAGPEEIRTILAGDPTELHPGAAGSIIAPVVGERSFMLQDEDDHAWGRKAITPAFHKRMVEKQATVIADVAERYIASWPLQTPIALHPYISSLTLMVILRIMFSAQNTELAALHRQLTPMLAVTDTLLLQGSRLRHLAGLMGIWRGFLRQRTEVDEILHRLIRQRRTSCGSDRPDDLLDMLLTADNPDGTPMSDEQIRDNLMSIILAGYETTTGQLAWAFQLLAHNPLTQHRLIEELDSTDGEDYLEATVNETMRHKPAFLFTIPRHVVKPVQIGGWTYRPPVRLAACTYLLHHNPELYPDPHTFRPERFLGTTAQPRTWLPWGGGRKHCLGHHFAMLEIQTVLRHVLASKLVAPTSRNIERPRWRRAILVPSAGSRIILQPRHR
jgi:cytochrome P450